MIIHRQFRNLSKYICIIIEFETINKKNEQKRGKKKEALPAESSNHCKIELLDNGNEKENKNKNVPCIKSYCLHPASRS